MPSRPILLVACSAVVVIAACRGESREGRATKELAPVDASAADVVRRSAPPASFAGVFHLLAGQPAVNLLLSDDGTFVWQYEDCVCAGGGWGTWEVAGASVVLHPPPQIGAGPPTATLQWATPVALDGGRLTVDWKPAPEDVGRVTLTPSPSSSGLVAEVAWSRGGTQSQRWSPGRVCPVCRPAVPGPVPTGADAVACDQPMTTMHRSPGLACH